MGDLTTSKSDTKPPHFNNFFKVKRSIQKSRKMSKAHPPELKKYMDKKIHLKINGGRAVEGVLRGFDPFMNLVLDDALEFTKSGDRNYIGMVVLRGNSVVMLEARIGCSVLMSVNVMSAFFPLVKIRNINRMFAS